MKSFAVLLVLLISLPGCYQYRVLNTNNDPVNEYQETRLNSYAWGLINKPKDFHVPNCIDTNAIDEVIFAKNAGQSLITIVTLGFVSTVKVRWRCHKPCARVDSL